MNDIPPLLFRNRIDVLINLPANLFYSKNMRAEEIQERENRYKTF